jgi:ankyrin repeat protein
LEVVTALASLGANLNVPIDDGATPISIAAQTHHVEMVKALASLGADVRVRKKDGASPVFIAARQGTWRW